MRRSASKLSFDSVVGNVEAKLYGDKLAKALSEALGKPIDEPMGLRVCAVCVGVLVCTDENATARTLQEKATIRQAFELAGVPNAMLCNDPKNRVGPDQIQIVIGAKK